jgi:hypothetical protein
LSHAADPVLFANLPLPHAGRPPEITFQDIPQTEKLVLQGLRRKGGVLREIKKGISEIFDI